MRKSLFIAAVAAAALAIAPAANAATGTQTVTGTVLGTITVAATPATFGTSLAPGTTAATAVPANVVVTNTSGGWSLTAGDASATTPGRMDADAVGINPACAGSASSLAQPIRVQVGTATSILGGSWNPGAGIADFALPSNSSPFAIGSLAGTAGLGGTATIPVSYSQQIGAGEAINALCTYSITTTYTATGA